MFRQKGNYYLNSISSGLDDALYDTLLYEMNTVMYNYGDHQKANIGSFRSMFRRILRGLFFRLVSLQLIRPASGSNCKKLALTNAYVAINLPELTNYLPPWVPSLNRKSLLDPILARTIRSLYMSLDRKSLETLLSEDFLRLITRYESQFSDLLKCRNVSCIIVPNDLSFFENLSVKIARKAGVPTFVYLHGIPGRYNEIDDNRADYLIVWGKGLKALYTSAGFSPNKILSIKHPYYSNFSAKSLRSGLENVLVITKAVPGTPSSSNELIVPDRSKSLLYLDLVMKLLWRLGVQNAKLKLHPSESEKFYRKNLVGKFYNIVTGNKEEILGKASLVIGPTSTMVLDAIKSGVNYILFEPLVDGITLEGSPIRVSPFDGSSFISLSENLEDFERHIFKPESNVDFTKLEEFFEVDTEDFERFKRIAFR